MSGRARRSKVGGRSVQRVEASWQDGRPFVAVAWTAGAALHARAAWLSDGSPTALRLVATALAVVAVVGVGLLLVVGGERVLLGAAVAGTVGVGSWFLGVMLVEPPDGGVDLWGFATVLLDGLTVRLAALSLWRGRHAARRPPSETAEGPRPATGRGATEPRDRDSQ